MFGGHGFVLGRSSVFQARGHVVFLPFRNIQASMNQQVGEVEL